MPILAGTAGSPSRPASTEIATAPPAFVEILAGLLEPRAAVVRLAAGTGGFPRTVGAFDAQGQPVPQPLAYRQAAARWIVQCFPGLDPEHAHELDLATGCLTAVSVTDTPAMAA
ncbi:hypothetical protein AB0F71_02250 [Kitasatospora sp. NPDC028055]|uniref:hypothetical protein n=1 Tax=Kitasatospora sp. NPDC028055 TaxID=3155653 RepID=UPI0033D3977E